TPSTTPPPPPHPYPRSLHDALPISLLGEAASGTRPRMDDGAPAPGRRIEGRELEAAVPRKPRGDLLGRQIEPAGLDRFVGRGIRSEEHTSELQSRENLVCRLLLEKK